jgi:hypothetical protein
VCCTKNTCKIICAQAIELGAFASWQAKLSLVHGANWRSFVNGQATFSKLYLTGKVVKTMHQIDQFMLATPGGFL